ncbi:MAG TPA: LuxR C-terminal-related transcriptional regulator [Gaiellaceae bacterium]|jgi:DNA-binding CsgD family transcriptional regulator|nr:LuxR C-terminal-related transcriptional regulator [Gaiellaceae bacterium]
MRHFAPAEEDPYYEELRRMAPELARSVAKLRVPAYVLDRTGTVRWMNAAAIRHFGDLRGQHIANIVAPEDRTLARQEFTSKVLGLTETTEGRVTIRTAEGKSVPIDVSSTQLIEGNTIMGVFGLADPAAEPVPVINAGPHLTPRQMEVLRHLAAGHSTERIAAALGIATETVRNHVRGIMERLEVHSRLEAVIRAHSLGLI